MISAKEEPFNNPLVASTAWAKGSAYPTVSKTPPIIFKSIHAPLNKLMVTMIKAPIPDTWFTVNRDPIIIPKQIHIMAIKKKITREANILLNVAPRIAPITKQTKTWQNAIGIKGKVYASIKSKDFNGVVKSRIKKALCLSFAINVPENMVTNAKLKIIIPGVND